MLGRTLPLLALLWLTGFPSLASAAPRVGLVVLSHPGLTTDQADEIAYDLAGAIASQIEGEAIAGQSVRDLLPPEGVASGCEENPTCGRELAATLKTDEVLFLSMKKSGKGTAVELRRVPRDADKATGDGALHLAGSSTKRGQAISTLVTTLFPSGSVQAFVPPPPPAETEPPPEAIVEKKTKTKAKKAAQADEEESEPVYRKKWFWPVIGGGAGAVVLAVVLGVTLGTTKDPTGPTITLP